MPEKPGEPRGDRPALDLAIPGARPFMLARDSAATVFIGVSRKGFAQNWTGRLEKVNPAMGSITIIRSDFRRHRRAASVCGWRHRTESDNAVQEALDKADKPTGLALRIEGAATR